MSHSLYTGSLYKNNLCLDWYDMGQNLKIMKGTRLLISVDRVVLSVKREVLKKVNYITKDENLV